MFRDSLSMLVAFALTLFALNPALDAQYSGSADPQAGQYPSITQRPDAVAPEPPLGTDSSPDAQANPEQDAAADGKHGVARISIVQGDVNVRRADTGELTAAVLNAPLVTQDHLQTAEGSRAEVELDSATIVRLAPNTDVGFADLEYHRYQIQLGAGSVICRVLRNSAVSVEVDTPSIGFRPSAEGEFRISVLDDGTTQITARSGQGEIFGPRGSQPLQAGQTLLIRGEANDPQFRNVGQAARDQFDDWSAGRDRELLGSQSYRYVSTDIAGAEDLDRYGNWVPSQYGQVWAPQAQMGGWSPYSTGQWSWEDYYRWSWVDSEPWGWAPYHYGRWFHNGGYGWCWRPGAIRSSCFWSPAQVGFFGWGGFGVGIGGLGWCALAPFETFHRWWGPGWYGHGRDRYGYGGGRGFRPYSNFARNADIARTYRNAGYRGGAMVAGYNGFGGPHQRFAQATRAQLTNANSFRGGQMPLAPSRASYRFSNRTAVANPRLAVAAQRQFFQSSRVGNAGFHTGQNGAPQNGVNRFSANPPANSAVGRNLNSSGPQMHGVPPNMQGGFKNRGNAPMSRSAASGWQRFGDPGRAGGALRQGFTSGSEQGGWHNFGQPPGTAGTTQGRNFQGWNGGRTSAAPSNRSNSPATPRAYSPGSSGQRFSGPAYSAPRYSSPGFSAPRFSPPSTHMSSPSFSRPSGGGSFHGNGGGGSFGSSGHSGGSFGSGGSHGGASSGGGHGGGGHHR